MPVSIKTTTIQEDGQDKPAIEVAFTNGAKQQIEELRQYFNVPSEMEVIKLGISVLQNLKDKEEIKKNSPS